MPDWDGTEGKEFLLKSNLLPISLWILTFCWMGMIFFLSSQNGSQTASTSGGIANTAAEIIYAKPTIQQINSIHFDIRKLTHVGLFLALGVLLYWALKSTFVISGGKNGLIPIALAISISSFYGLFDEWHKQFIPGRHFDVGETLINICSGIGGVVLAYIVLVYLSQYVKRSRV